MDTRLVLTVLALMASSAATATASQMGREQNCAGEVSEMAGIQMSEVRVAYTNNSRAMTEVHLEYPGGSAVCFADDEKVHDIHWNHEQGHSSSSTKVTADRNGQEQACAGAFSQRMHTPMSDVRVVESVPSKHGNLKVTVRVPGMKARCNVNSGYNVVGLKFLGDQ